MQKGVGGRREGGGFGWVGVVCARLRGVAPGCAVASILAARTSVLLARASAGAAVRIPLLWTSCTL
jgi:hypothetical protein